MVASAFLDDLVVECILKVLCEVACFLELFATRLILIFHILIHECFEISFTWRVHILIRQQKIFFINEFAGSLV